MVFVRSGTEVLVCFVLHPRAPPPSSFALTRQHAVLLRAQAVEWEKSQGSGGHMAASTPSDVGDTVAAAKPRDQPRLAHGEHAVDAANAAQNDPPSDNVFSAAAPRAGLGQAGMGEPGTPWTFFWRLHEIECY